MRLSFLIVGLILFISGLAQDKKITKEDSYEIYSNFVGGKWETKGTWKSGASFHQVIVVEPELTKNIFTVKTHDYIDSKKYDHSRRNYGIRAWDNKEKKMKFWEFDVFGGITSGEVVIDGKNIYHVYPYTMDNGETKQLADAWIYINDDTYTYKIAEYADGKLGKEYMSSKYTRVRD